MKSKITFYIICLIAISFVAFVACTDDGDTTKPVINLIEPADGDTLHIGGEVHFDMELSDDVMLRSYKVDIHSAAGHDHNARATESYTYEKTWDVSGKKNTDIHHHEIVIDSTATPGEYHFLVYCTDAAGNETHVVRNIVLSTEGGEEHDH